MNKESVSDFVKRNSILTYSVLAYVITWIIVLPLVLSAFEIISVEMPYILHYFAPYGPLLAAFLVTYLEKQGEGVKELVGRLGKWKVQPTLILIALLSPWIFFIVAGISVMFMSGAFPNLDLFGMIPYGSEDLYLTVIGAWLVWILTYGLGEETGWRGFLLPRIQSKYNALNSALIVGAIWCFWHVPFFFYNPNFQSFGLFGSIMWAVGLLFGSIFLTWLYNSCEGSILMVILWHGTFNLFTATSGQATASIASIISTLVMVFVIIILVIFKPTTLSDQEKQVA